MLTHLLVISCPSSSLIVGLSEHGIHQALEGAALVDVIDITAHRVVVMMVLGIALVWPLEMFYWREPNVDRRVRWCHLNSNSLPFCWAGRPWSGRAGAPHVPGCRRSPCSPPAGRGTSRSSTGRRRVCSCICILSICPSGSPPYRLPISQSGVVYCVWVGCWLVEFGSGWFRGRLHSVGLIGVGGRLYI